MTAWKSDRCRRLAPPRRPPPAGRPPGGGSPWTANSRPTRNTGAPPFTGLARALSKLGFCSRTEAEALIRGGRVRVDAHLVRNPEHAVDWRRQDIAVDGHVVRPAARVYLMLNKPRGLVTTHRDERGRPTVFTCLAGLNLRHVAPVGRLDQASEGLLLFTNDTAWAAAITDPKSKIPKVYHVQIDWLAEGRLLRQLLHGVDDAGERLRVRTVRELRRGERNAWLEITLDEGRNRHLRRMFARLGIEVHRLIRVAIGSLALGNLPKGASRHLTPTEVAALSPH